jgi:biotin carboxylase
MTERWLIAVGAGRWQMSGIRAAQGEGIRVLALDGSKSAPGLAVAERFALADIRDPETSIQAVRDSGIRPAGAIAFVSDAGMMTAAALRETFGLPGPDRALALRLTNKCHQRRAWGDAGLPCPEWHCVMNEEQASAAISTLNGTFIIKPSDSAGSRGISVIAPGEDWRAAVAAAFDGSWSGSAIIESFISGAEYTVETFSHHGNAIVLAISEKRKVPGSRGTVAMELATSALPSTEVDRIGKLAIDALAALGHRDGPGHTEILRDESGALWLVEAAGRGGGFMVADGIVLRASGYDLARATALQAVGLEPPPPPVASHRAFVLRFLPAKPGIVISMSGFDRAASVGDVECGPLASVGDKVERAKTDGARLAYILSWADDRFAAISLADEAEACLRVEVAETPCQ